jgi:dihydrofolate reductase
VLRCSVFIATSLDGYIARDDGSLDWLDRVQLPGEDYGYAKFFAAVDALVIGRGTYEATLRFAEWPYAGKRVAVMTHQAPQPRHGERFVSGTPREVLETLEREGCRHAYVDGGAVIRQFLAARLLDELTISIVPIVLGSGIRLFDRGIGEHPLELVESRSWPSGLVQVPYRASPPRSTQA